MLTKALARLIALSSMIGFALSPAIAEAPDAAAQEVRWFVGKWATGPADVPGFETIAGNPDCKTAVDISATGPATIQRTARLRDGTSHTSEFRVKSFNGNFPWWSKDGIGGPVAKRTGADSFVLATTRNGKADWAGARKHTRCPG
jgi:hypothetical protein